MRRFLLCAWIAAACGDNGKTQLRDDAGTSAPPDAGADTPGGPAAGRVVGCLDTPELPAAPIDRLPCDLVPPGLAL